ELPMAWIRWVLPRPTPPYRNNGLYEVPGFSATCKAAARANWLALPVTKLSNVSSALRRDLSYTTVASVCVSMPAGEGSGAVRCATEPYGPSVKGEDAAVGAGPPKVGPAPG